MQLAEREYFDLDEPVEDYLTSFKIKPKKGPRGTLLPPVTFRQLLSHTAGFDTFGPFGRGRNIVWQPNPRSLRPVPRVNEYYESGLSTPFNPGQEYHFSFTGYAVLGQVIEGTLALC